MEPVAVCPNFKPTEYDFQMDASYPCSMSKWHCRWWMDCAAPLTTAEHSACSFRLFFARPAAMEDAAVNRLAKSITQLTLCQVTKDEVDAATKLLDKACQKLRGIPDVPFQRITDLEAAMRQMRQLSCILDSCTISASYEVSQAQKAILAYKGGPNSVSKNHISFRCKKRTQKLASCTFLSWSWQSFPFYYVDASLQSRRFEARRGLGEARRGQARPGRGHATDENVLAQGQSEAHGDSKLYNTIVEVPVRLNLK